MFYFDGDRWRPYPKRIQYTERVTTYDVITEPYADKNGLKIEDVVLSEEQRARLEAIKHVTTMSLESLVEYVMGEIPKEKPSKEFAQAVRNQEERDAIEALIDVETAPAETLVKMKGIICDHEPGAYLKKKAVISYGGDLYIVKKAHEVVEGMNPDMMPKYYKKKKRGATDENQSKR